MTRKKTRNEKQLLFKDLTYKIIGACYNVYREMGCGFLESVYQECLEIELSKQNIPYKSQESIKINYGDYLLSQNYIADFLCYDKIIVEIKAISSLTEIHEAQVINYLKATRLQLGLLFNFGNYPKLDFKRIISSKGRFKNE